eukprot:3031988-Rhodomonas_salina.2
MSGIVVAQPMSGIVVAQLLRVRRGLFCVSELQGRKTRCGTSRLDAVPRTCTPAQADVACVRACVRACVSGRMARRWTPQRRSGTTGWR